MDKGKLISLDEFGMSEEELFSRVDNSEAEAEKITAPRYSYWRSVMRVFFKKRINIIILAILAVLVIFAYVYPMFSGYDKYANLMLEGAKHLTPKAAIAKHGFSIHWIFGAGAVGQSTFDALWSGARISLSLAFVCAAINMTIGVIIGAVWGLSKRVDVIMTEDYNIIGNVP